MARDARKGQGAGQGAEVERWRELASKELRGRDPEELVWETPEGLRVRPLYTAADLETLLETNMRRFLDDPSRNRIDRERRELRLSRIFEWYAEDFGGPQELARYVDGFVDGDVAGFDVSFLEYSWELNLAGSRSTSSLTRE